MLLYPENLGFTLRDPVDLKNAVLASRDSLSPVELLVLAQVYRRLAGADFDLVKRVMVETGEGANDEVGESGDLDYSLNSSGLLGQGETPVVEKETESIEKPSLQTKEEQLEDYVL